MCVGKILRKEYKKMKYIVSSCKTWRIYTAWRVSQMSKFEKSKGDVEKMLKKRMIAISMLIVIIIGNMCGCCRYADDTNESEYIYSCFYGGENDIVYEDVDSVIEYVNALGCNALTVPVAWNLVEQEDGIIDYSIYTSIFDALIEKKIQIIVVIDAGGRPILKDGNIVGYSIPSWVYEKYPEDIALNFDGEGGNSLDYFSDKHISELLEFYNKTLDWLNDNYKDNIIGVAPGIMGEFEIKYAQTGFKWQSYTDNAKCAFRNYLLDKYESIQQINETLMTDYDNIDEIELPIIDYNNTVAFPNADEVLYTDFMSFREDGIVEYAQNFTDAIRKHGFDTIGYFGQFMFPIDAIYASGVVQKCADLFDIAVIDYNFYDGYKVQYNSDIPAFLTNLVYNLGYEKVITGLYFERLSLDGKDDFIKELCSNIKRDGHSSGIEVGSMAYKTDNIFGFDVKSTEYEESKIAIYTSEWNFYKTHGEYEEYQNYLSDSVVELYHILEFELNIPVEIISDNNILKGDLKNYDLVFFPCQMYIQRDIIEDIENYKQNGGKIIQDFRFGEYDNYGNVINGSCVFEIESQMAISGEYNISGKKDLNYEFALSPIYDVVPTAYMYSSEKTNKILMGQDSGYLCFMTENTLTWGFQPQLQYMQSGNEKYCEFIKDSIELMLN